MSERRQLALLLAGLVVLVAVGIGGATLFPEPCSGLEQLGDLELEFVDAADALPLSDADGEAVEAVGEEVDIGPWRGAVALPDDAWILPSEFGFFVVTETDFTVLRPSIGIASAARGRDGLDVLPAGRAIALRAPDGETGVYDGEYELERCGTLPSDADVLAIDRGFAAVGDDAGTRLVTLSGDEVWSSEVAAAAAHISGDWVLLSTPDGQLRLVDVRTGELLDELEAGNRLPGWWWADHQGVVIQDGSGPLAVDVVDGTLVPREQVISAPPTGEPLHGIVRTGAGLLALGTTLVDGAEAAALTIGGPEVRLPAGVQAVRLDRSPTGLVGLLVEVDGARALLLYGPDS